MKPNSNFNKGISLAGALLLMSTAAYGQTFYSANGFEPPTFDSPNTPTDPLALQNAWMTNDPLNPASAASNQLVGNSNFVGPITNFVGTPGFSGQSAAIGGIYRVTPGTGTAGPTGSPDVVPGMAMSQVGRPFALTSTDPYAFNTDLLITTSGNDSAGNPTGLTNHDSFGFSLENTAGTATLASINFTPSLVIPNTADRVTYTVGGTTASLQAARIFLDASYHLLVTVNQSANTFSAVLNSNTDSTSQIVAQNVSFVTSGDASSVGQIAATWTLADRTQNAATGGYDGAGTNFLAFDNYGIAAVPEPSTYVASGLISLVGLASVLRRRRRQVAV